MKSEYMGLSGTEKVFGQKNFLQAQLELLQITNALDKFRKLRKEEFFLKVALKSRVGETLELISNLEKTLPKTSGKIESSGVMKRDRRTKETIGLQNEIEEIRRKIEGLRGN